jgi:UDP-N-acetylmuramate: L-alanyl-gamma-D-glutamyl-meso-diaminopimelate ligase
VHRDTLAASLQGADQVWLHEPEGLVWSLQAVADAAGLPVRVSDSVKEIVDEVLAEARPGDHVLVMSNGGFGGIHEELLIGLK